MNTTEKKYEKTQYISTNNKASLEPKTGRIRAQNCQLKRKRIKITFQHNFGYDKPNATRGNIMTSTFLCDHPRLCSFPYQK